MKSREDALSQQSAVACGFRLVWHASGRRGFRRAESRFSSTTRISPRASSSKHPLVGRELEPHDRPRVPSSDLSGRLQPSSASPAQSLKQLERQREDAEPRRRKRNTSRRVPHARKRSDTSSAVHCRRRGSPGTLAPARRAPAARAEAGSILPSLPNGCAKAVHFSI